MKNIEKIKREIFLHPTRKYHIRELALALQLNPNTVITLSEKLAKEGIIKRKKERHVVEISADSENKAFIRKKRLWNIGQLYDSGLVDFLVGYYDSPEAVMVIGSYSRGEDIEKSDIDIVIINGKESIPETEGYERFLKRKIHLLPVRYEKVSKEFYANMINGITLHGFIR